MDKLDLSSNDLAAVTAVIPARLESSRIKHKVLQEIPSSQGPISLIENKIKQARSVFENVIVSCGESKISSIAEKSGATGSWRAQKFIEEKYAVSTAESVRETIKGVGTDYVAWCPPVVPFHDKKVLKAAYLKFLRLSKTFDSLATAFFDKSYYWYKREPINYRADHQHVQSQLLDPVARMSNGIYIAPTSVMRERGYFLGARPFLMPVSQIEALDIDDDADLLICRAVAQVLAETDRG